MKLVLKIFIFFISYISPLLLFAQAHKIDFNHLSPEPANTIFDLKLSYQEFIEFQKLSGQKIELYTGNLKINGNQLNMNSLTTRGSSTLKFLRKSLAISLKDSMKIGDVTLKRFALNNLAMDQNYWRNRFSYLLMKKLEIFPLENSFAELKINNNSFGIYLFIQKPEDYAHTIDCPVLIRREAKEKLFVEYATESKKEFLKKLKVSKDYPKHFSGQALLDSLNLVLNMDQYFSWLAFNYFISNGDYLDELFYYFNKQTGRFDLIAWDYDDIFKSYPHEGWEERNKYLTRSLLFSSESKFDLAINKDKVLYDNYLQAFDQMLKILTPQIIKQCFEDVYSELLPYFSNPGIISLSEYDEFGLTDLLKLQADMEEHLNFLMRRHKNLIIKINLARQQISRAAEK